MSEVNGRLDEAARAGWLYYIAGKTQDDIARIAERVAPDGAAARVAVPRRGAHHLPHQSHDRRVHEPRVAIARAAHGLGALRRRARPTGPMQRAIAGIAEAASIAMERMLRSTEPLVMGLGTGRAMRASRRARGADVAAAPSHRVARWERFRPMAPQAASTRRSALAELTAPQHFPHAACRCTRPPRQQREQLLALDPGAARVRDGAGG